LSRHPSPRHCSSSPRPAPDSASPVGEGDVLHELAAGRLGWRARARRRHLPAVRRGALSALGAAQAAAVLQDDPHRSDLARVGAGRALAERDHVNPPRARAGRPPARPVTLRPTAERRRGEPLPGAPLRHVQARHETGARGAQPDCRDREGAGTWRAHRAPAGGDADPRRPRGAGDPGGLAADPPSALHGRRLHGPPVE
jgi:hypothetical protein